ncbi:hypothetical protein C0J45_23775, partial [Silurus meridionalis]
LFKHYVLFSMTGDSMADSIEPLFTHKAVDEGHNVILSCKFEPTYTTKYYLHWYRQHPKSKPEFLLFIHDLSGLKSDSIPPRLDVKLDKNNKQVNLIISSAAVSDSALYYCALQPTVTGNPAALYKNLDTGDSMADSIESLSTHKAVDEGDDVTLSCRYETSDTTPYLHWYRQQPKSKPVFLLYINPSGFKTNPMPPRLDAEVDKNNKQVDLIISSAAVSDSALYYCALSPTVTGNPAALYKNL